MPLVKVYTANDAIQAHFVRNLLEREGIIAHVLGDKLALALGGVPYTRSTLPAVWVADEAEQAAAQVVERMRRGEHLIDAPNWTCSHCGETLEPQFTECWNCGTQHQEGDEEAGKPPGPVAPPPSVIGLDVPCATCDYNLRSMTPTGRCPECGNAIMPSLLAFIDSVAPEQYADAESLLRGPIEVAAKGTGLPSAAVFFLIGAWVRTLAAVEPPAADEALAGDKRLRELYALELTRAIVGTAITDLGDREEAKRALASWGLETHRDIGDSLFSLIEHRLLEPTERVDLEDFPRKPLDPLFMPR